MPWMITHLLEERRDSYMILLGGSKWKNFQHELGGRRTRTSAIPTYGLRFEGDS